MVRAHDLASELGCRVDTVELETLAERGTLTRTPDGFDVSDEAAFDAWKDAKRVNLLVNCTPSRPDDETVTQGEFPDPDGGEPLQ